jgi:uncharacterized membrane protein YphA (DoxX/SURF4 family)
MNTALWIVQLVLCIAFLGSGGMKVFAYRKYKETVGRDIGLSKGLVTFIGISELAGALGLILPGFTGIAPILAPIAAAGLGVIMLLATGFHLMRKEPPWPTVVLLILAGFVVVGRGFG